MFIDIWFYLPTPTSYNRALNWALKKNEERNTYIDIATFWAKDDVEMFLFFPLHNYPN